MLVGKGIDLMLWGYDDVKTWELDICKEVEWDSLVPRGGRRMCACWIFFFLRVSPYFGTDLDRVFASVVVLLIANFGQNSRKKC